MSEAPYLALHISHSPLLTDAIPQTAYLVQKETTATRDLISALLTRCTLNHVHLHQSPRNLPTQNDLQDSHLGLSPSQSLLSIPCLPSQLPQPPTETNKPPPLLPHAFPIPHHAIISLLNLLDSLNADVANEVTRVTQHIKETHSLIDIYKAERAEEHKRVLSRREQEIHDTYPAHNDV